MDFDVPLPRQLFLGTLRAGAGGPSVRAPCIASHTGHPGCVKTEQRLTGSALPAPLLGPQTLGHSAVCRSPCGKIDDEAAPGSLEGA